MFDLIEVIALIQYTQGSVQYQVSFEKSSISGRIQNIQYYYDGEECELDDLWDGTDINQFKDMVNNYQKYHHTITEA